MLTDAEYTRIVQDRATLQGLIDAAEAEKAHHDGLKQKAQARKDKHSEEMSLYTNFLKDAIEEYEAAHPEEP